MTTKVEKAAAVEPLHVRPTVSANSPKVSKFGTKTGFVIPKNKLSGSLVPTVRGKVDSGDSIKEENDKQVHRKTKWGIDLAQEAAIRTGRILAYQTRLEQITEQLKAGALDIGKDQSLKTQMQSLTHEPAEDILDQEHQDLEHLELEKREIIGEILRLNPSYKAPPDYKPLLKEAKVPIPAYLLKMYPGYNFIGLLLGPESNTQKRLEEETGAKIEVHGTKADTGEKLEITQSDLNEAQAAYEELYVLVSADTFEKVDAAVALIELLVTPVSGNHVVAPASDSAVVPSQDSASTFAGMSMGTISQVSMQPMVMPVQSDPMLHQVYSGPWYPIGQANAPMQPPSGYMPPPMPNNSVRFPLSPISPSNTPPFFGVRPPSCLPPTNSPGVGGIPPHLHALQRPLNPAVPYLNPSLPVKQPQSLYPAMPAQPTSNPPASFPAATQMMPAPALPQGQPMSMSPVSSFPSRPSTSLLVPVGSSGWSSASSASLPPLRPNNLQMPPPASVPHQRPHVVQQSSLISTPSQQNMPAQVVSKPLPANFNAPAAFPSQPSTAPPAFSSAPPQSGPTGVSGGPGRPPIFIHPAAPRPRPVSAPAPSPSLAPQVPGFVSPSAPAAVQVPVSTPSAALPVAPPLGPVPSLGPGRAPMPVPRPMPPAMPGSVSGSMHIFSHTNLPGMCSASIQPITVPKPPLPSSGDFTFQPLRSQVSSRPPNNQPVALGTTTVPGSAFQMPLPQNSSQFLLAAPRPPLAQNTTQMPLLVPQAPSFRPAIQNPGMSSGPRPMAVNQLGPPQTPIPLPSSTSIAHSSNMANLRPQPGFPPFPNSQNIAPTNPLSQRGHSSFFPAPQGSAVMRPTTMMPLSNQLPPAGQSHGLLVPIRHLGKLAIGSGGNQIYDPFSPTSVSPVPPQKKDEQAKAGKPDSDAEYEDLMASVGVR